LQTVIDNLILRESTGDDSGVLNYGLVGMETQRYREDSFGFILTFLIPYFFLLSFLLPIITLINKIMKEKVTQIFKHCVLGNQIEGDYADHRIERYHLLAQHVYFICLFITRCFLCLCCHSHD